MRKYQKVSLFGHRYLLRFCPNKSGFIQHQRQRIGAGFTLVELLVVIAVIGLLAAGLLILVNPLGQLQKARNAQRKSDLRQLANALERYYSVNGSYPNTSLNWCGVNGRIKCPQQPSYSDYCNNNNLDWIPGLVSSGELKALPKDPRTCQLNMNYPVDDCSASPISNEYKYKSDGKDYKIAAYCTPEGQLDTTDPFYDSAIPASYPPAPNHAWSIYSPGAVGWY